MSNSRLFESVKICAFVTAATIVFGIIHDEVTAHLCVEYFTVAHPPVFPTKSPFMLALGWGIIATWWVGLPLGLGLAAAAQAGLVPPVGLGQLRRPIVILMVACAVVALAAGVVGAVLVATSMMPVPGGWGAAIPPDKQVAFSGAAWAHGASYGFGALGGVFLIVRTARMRIRSGKGAVTAD